MCFSYLVDVGEHAEQVPLLTLLDQNLGQGLHVPAALDGVPPRVEPGHRGVRDDEIRVSRHLFRSIYQKVNECHFNCCLLN